MPAYDFRSLLRVDRHSRELHIATLAKFMTEPRLVDPLAPIMAPTQRDHTSEERELHRHWFEVWHTER
jgi:hypothetical protein